MRKKSKINLNVIIQKATSAEVSPILIMKRECGYRKAKPTEPQCRTCKMFSSVTFGKKTRTQCEWIGISLERTADIELNHCCDYHVMKIS